MSIYAYEFIFMYNNSMRWPFLIIFYLIIYKMALYSLFVIDFPLSYFSLSCRIAPRFLTILIPTHHFVRPLPPPSVHPTHTQWRPFSDWVRVNLYLYTNACICTQRHHLDSISLYDMWPDLLNSSSNVRVYKLRCWLVSYVYCMPSIPIYTCVSSLIRIHCAVK